MQSAVNRYTLGKKSLNDKRIFPFSYHNAREMWITMIKKTGLNQRDKTTDRYKYHIHTLRKFFRSRMPKAIGVDMTDAMLEKAAEGARQMGLTNVEFRKGLAEELPVEDEYIDVVISNGVINLCPDKEAVMREVHRVLKPGGRFQIADIVVHKEVPQSAKDNIDLWSG